MVRCRRRLISSITLGGMGDESLVRLVMLSFNIGRDEALRLLRELKITLDPFELYKQDEPEDDSDPSEPGM